MGKEQNKTIKKAGNYIQLHTKYSALLATSVFSKCASVQFNHGGIKNPLLYLFLFLMTANCYLRDCQKVIKKILAVHSIREQKRISDLVSGVGSCDFS